jgi:cyanophycin synthetase
VDYAHNASAVMGLMDMVRAIPAAQRIGVIAAPGDRRDEDIRQLGRLCASALDHVIVKEDADLRGREPGAVAALLREGLVAGGLAPDRIEIVPAEREAVDRAIALATEHDVVIVLADKVGDVLAHLRDHGAS